MVLEGRCKATWKRESKLPWREAGPPNHHDDKVDVGDAREMPTQRSYLTQSVYKVVFQKSIPTQIRERNLYYY